MCTSRKSFCTDEIYAWFCGAADTFIEKVTVPALAKASKVPAYVPREVRRQWDKFTQVAAMLNKRIAQYLNRYHTSSNNLPTVERHWSNRFKAWMQRENLSLSLLEAPAPVFGRVPVVQL